jgi:hypothetical protein
LVGNTLVGNYDFFVAKYDSTGSKVYTKQTGTAGVDTNANGVAVDANGDVYVVGDTNGGLDGNALTGYIDFFVTRYDSSGTKVYTRQMGTTGAYTHANGVAVDANGNVYVAGSTSGGLDGNAGNTVAGNYDYFVAKYDSSGTKVYTKQMGVPGVGTFAVGVAMDASGNAYVAGYTTGGLDGNTLAGGYDFFVAKYDSMGNKQ